MRRSRQKTCAVDGRALDCRQSAARGGRRGAVVLVRCGSYAVQNFGNRDAGDVRCGGWLFGYPIDHSRFGCGFHQLWYDVRIEDDHLPRSGGARIGSRGGRIRSIPPSAWKRARMDAARLRVVGVSSDSTVRRIVRASSSIERLWCAARMRNRIFVCSSRFLIVMLAITENHSNQRFFAQAVRRSVIAPSNHRQSGSSRRESDRQPVSTKTPPGRRSAQGSRILWTDAYRRPDRAWPWPP